MSTAQSPVRKLKAEARRAASQLKAIERGDISVPDPAGKLAAARKRETFTFAVAMDDKVIKIEIPWSKIRETSRAGLAEFIFDQMRESREGIH